MQMPIDLRVISKKDSVYDFNIPNTWFEKQEDNNPPAKNFAGHKTPYQMATVGISWNLLTMPWLPSQGELRT